MNQRSLTEGKKLCIIKEWERGSEGFFKGARERGSVGSEVSLLAGESILFPSFPSFPPFSPFSFPLSLRSPVLSSSLRLLLLLLFNIVRVSFAYHRAGQEGTDARLVVAVDVYLRLEQHMQ